ncbi:GNAT family N-acetyltransferase [uncultured Roseobacter sp.]|uniref:GNAT family N-acetyltransferase n=1 Tax=uncultured Roseobacter sp. TaxID=114847 RepID=UPI0026086B07|nr:GNAT family N-acetyltransferase [uncultured Roseobacter sp.]
MFDAAPDTPPTALQQSAEFAGALELLGQMPRRLPDGTLALQRRWKGLPVTLLSRAQVHNPSALWRHLAGSRTRGPVIISPDHPVDLVPEGALPLVSPATIARLDLSGTEETLASGLHQKWRNRLKHAQGQNLRVTRQNMPDDPGHWLLRADSAQQRRRGYRNWPTAMTIAWLRANAGKAKLFTALDGKETVAGLLILRHGNAGTYHIGHTTARGRRCSAHTLLLWSALTWLQRKSADTVDLGIISTEDAPGLARFKLGTGAGVHRLGGTWVWWPPVTPVFRGIARLDNRLMQGLWTDR